MSKHLLLYTDDPGVGGVAQYNHAILTGLLGLGYRVTCVQSKSDNPLINSQKQLGIQHIWLNFDTSREFGRTLTYQADAQNILTTYKPDFIIFSDCCPLSNFAAKQVAIDIEIPYIVVIGFVAPYLAERFTAYLNELSYQYSQAQAVIAVSQENLSLLHKLFRLPNNKGQVIYYGRTEQYFTPPVLSIRERLRQEFDIPLNAVVCFTSARLEAVKGYQYQLEAIKQLKQSEIWDKLYLVWAGAGSLEAQLKEAIEQLGVSSHVKLLGHRWDVQDWLDASDIFVLPSELEGMPLCIMEAMAKGLPVVASAVSGIPEELDNAGKLLADPKLEPQTTVVELVSTIQTWSINPELRQTAGLACKKRAKEMFKEERMVKETVEVVERALVPVGDYVSPGFSIVLPDKHFPNMMVGDTNACAWSYLRRDIPHNWYVDKRQPTVGFLSRDEAHIIYNTALKFKNKRALEIGCWLGWSACHLALAGVELDVVDPLLERPEFYESVSNSLKAAGVLDSVNLVAGFSPQKVEDIASQFQRKWSLIFIDENHDAPGPLNDAIACEQLAASDALILFHDLASPDVAQGLEYLKQRGWNTMVYQTMQIMGVAWRGNIEPVRHQPDPKVDWELPTHLQLYSVYYLSTDPLENDFSEILNAIRPYTLLSEARLFSLYSLAKQICLNDIPGNFVECGTCKGGSAALLAYVIQRYSLRPRLLYAFDTFEGMPDPMEVDRHDGIPANATGFGAGTLKAPISENLDKICQSLKVTDIVIPVKGLFAQTLPKYKSEVDIIAFLHADGDWYESTMDIFNTLYVNIIPNGIIQVGDYGHWEGCKKAIHDFESLRGESFDLHKIDYTGVWFQKTKANDDIDRFSPQISSHIYQYQKDPTNQSTLADLRQARQEIANQWVSLPVDQLENAYVGKLGKIHKMLLDSSIKNETLTDVEQNFLNEIVANIFSGFDAPKSINYLLVAMLYRRADQLPLQHDLNRIPNYLLNDYLKFILYAPTYFQEIGEADIYYHYMQGCICYLHRNVLSNPDSKLWQNAALFFIENANFIPLYFNSENLRNIYAKRADIMEFTLRNQGHQIDYEFPERSSERKKIRLGILAAHFGSQTETFTTLPIYKHLNWNKFEVILYTLHFNSHRLEHYCVGHADTIVTLPQDLQSQVQTIRDGDLDILLIGTNVTAVTNTITLLALHRLARVQVSSVSPPVTTGMQNIDYYISGSLTEPVQGAQEHYCEQLVTIDGPAQCFDYVLEPEPVEIKIDKESLGIPDNSIVFISGANFYKIVPELRETWAKITASVPESVLVLYPFSPSWSNSYEAIPFLNSMRAIFDKYSIEKERLIVLDALPSRSDVKEYLKLGDVYLDSYPYSGANSTVDPLEIGVPPVVMDGNSLRSRQAAALLREMQISDLIANSEETYIQLAIALGTNPELRKQKSEQIKQRMQTNPRFLDSRSYSAQMGAVFQDLFRKYQENTLTKDLNLRENNLIIFPDWSQSEETLSLELEQVIRAIATHPDSSKTTLLINCGNFSEEDAALIVSSVSMNLLMQEDLDISEGLEISFVQQLSEIQWQALLPQIQARVALENEDREAIAQAKAENLQPLALNSLS